MLERRAEPRTPCKIRATAYCRGRSSPAAVLDLSRQGLRVYLRLDIRADVGSLVTVATDELGSLPGEVRWIQFPYLGIEFVRSSNTSAKVESYFKALP